MTLQMATTRTRLSHQRLHLQLHRSPPLTRLRHVGTGTHHATAQRRAPRRWRPRRNQSPLPLRRPRPAARLRSPRHPLRVRVRRAPPVRGYSASGRASSMSGTDGPKLGLQRRRPQRRRGGTRLLSVQSQGPRLQHYFTPPTQLHLDIKPANKAASSPAREPSHRGQGLAKG